MEQEFTLQFVRGQTALLITSIVLVSVLIDSVARYARLVRKWRAVGIRIRGRQVVSRVLAPMLILALLGFAFAEPYLVHRQEVFERNDAEVCYLFDNAGSMAASVESGSPTRMDRALAIARSLTASGAMEGVPTCIGTFTAKTSIHLPSTAHTPTVLGVLEDVIVVGDPPPTSGCRQGEVCTSFNAIEEAARMLFSNNDDSIRRVLVVFTDGETKSFPEQSTAAALENRGIDVVFVDLWSLDERIFNTPGCVETVDGCADLNYSSDLLGREIFLGFVQLSESELIPEVEQDRLSDVMEELLGSPTAEGQIPISTSEEQKPLAWFFAALAGLVAAGVYSEHAFGLLKPVKRYRQKK